VTAKLAILALAGAAALAGVPAGEGPIAFRDVTKPAGIRTRFRSDLARGRMISTMGGGVAFGDYDGDGFLDLFFTGSAENGKHPEKGPCGTLFRNRGDGTFEDATMSSGVRACGWQMGAFWVDVDSDGRPDLIVTGVESFTVWRNRGDGTFEEISRARGIGPAPEFTIGIAAGDYDGDGRVDLYLLGYVATDPKKELSFPKFQIRMPEDLPPGEGKLFRQLADGSFQDVTAAAACANPGGKGTGAVFFDYDGDGRADLFIANDRASNRLYRNAGAGRFEDVTDQTGAGSREGRPRAGMGIAVGDPFGSGRPSLYVTNFSGETNTLYRNLEGELFDDATEEAGAGAASWPYVEWGTHFVDFDNDGWPDLYAVSGQLVPRILLPFARLFGKRELSVFDKGDLSYRQPIVLLRNVGDGRFEDASRQAGDLASVRLCARGSAVGDYDGDGRPDLAVAAISGGARLFQNVSPAAGHAIDILPVAGAGGRTALGTKVRITAQGRSHIQEFILAPSYASGSWVPLHFGLGSATVVDSIEVIPPGATVPAQRFTEVAADGLYRLRDGELSLVRRFSPR
jgi:hypothetical protein